MKKTICFVLILAFAATALYGCGSADSTPTGESGSSDTTLPSILDTSKEDPLVITQIQTQSGTFNALYIYEVVSCTGDLVKPGEYYYVSSSPINNYTFVASSNLLQHLMELEMIRPLKGENSQNS